MVESTEDDGERNVTPWLYMAPHSTLSMCAHLGSGGHLGLPEPARVERPLTVSRSNPDRFNPFARQGAVYSCTPPGSDIVAYGNILKSR